ncbi:MAG: UDP-N-acetylglucosamine 1-carboxyvinyltransferase, partial [Bacteroidales bacterium]|nr:UDP-N-acetylglucosamine 1-carboxyvinyltransferase [Bacteroidales bacterium]
MGSFKIRGGTPLSGSITPQGAKNEALQVICAVLLTPEEVSIQNVPDILDVQRLIELLEGLGVVITKKSAEHYTFNAANIDLSFLKTDTFYKKATAIRGSVMILGPLLARFGKGYLPQPGGDKIGRRRLDTHFIGLQKLGATFQYDEIKKSYRVNAPHLKGNFMLLEEASVTGTANILMAAVLAKGKTTIFNAACEPYIIQLSKMLNRMGAKINGIGSNLLTIEGVGELGGTAHTLLADMIEVGSFIGLAGMTQSELTIKNVSMADLGLIPEVFRRLGISTQQKGDDILVPQHEQYAIETFIDGSIMSISAAPWPGFT